MAAIRRLMRRQHGQALVEMAIILPLLLMLLFGIIEFGRVFNAQLVMSQASREGARTAAVGSSDAEVIDAVRNTSVYEDTELTIEITPSGDRERGIPVEVTVSYDVDLFAPVITEIASDPFTVSSSTVMRVE